MQDLASFEVLMRDWFLHWNLTYTAIIVGLMTVVMTILLASVGIYWIAKTLYLAKHKRRYPRLRLAKEPRDKSKDYESVA
ncbi:MAG: hypothetical protein AB7T49_11640 [Oligoflexales bacterium]